MTHQQAAFAFSSRTGPLANSVGRLDPLPNLQGEGIIALDVEHRGLGRGAIPVALCVAGKDQEWYLPFGHPEGKQYQWDQVRRWVIDNLPLNVIFKEAKNDIERLREFGLDLEALGHRPFEVRHAAALLDEYRRDFKLDTLAQDYLGIGKVVPTLAGRVVPPDEIPDLPADLAAPYGRRDARLTYDLYMKLEPLIEAEELEDVLELENDLIYCTLHMERQMAYMDVPKMDRWIKKVREAHGQRIMELKRRTGLRINPDAPTDMAKLFNYLGHGFHKTRQDKPSFTDEYLKKHEDVPEIALCIEARDLSSILSKYLIKYRLALDPKGRLPYLLHQLRGDEYGTITGRYASSKVNIQQVFKPDKQATVSPATAAWIIRELFIAGPETDHFNLRWTVHDEVNGDLGREFSHADANQIEYRCFAHYSNVPPPHSTRIIDAYNADPNLNYHKWVHKVLLKECMIYSHAKNLNFAKLYGAGVEKIAWMMGTSEDAADKIIKEYDRKLWEAKKLLWFCNDLAEKRRFIKTFLGRRRRFRDGDRFYSALNCVLQGTAADIMKLKLKRLYREMKNLTNVDLLKECYAIQEVPLRVPITWEVSHGKNWKEVS